MWDLPGSGIEPVLPALSGRFFTTEPPGKPTRVFFFFSPIFNVFMKILNTNLVTYFKDLLLLIYIIMAYI